MKTSLYMGRTGADQRLIIMPLGGTKKTLDETSNHGPVIGASKGIDAIAWTGTDQRLNFASVNGGKLGPKTTLSETSNVAPTIAAGTIG